MDKDTIIYYVIIGIISLIVFAFIMNLINGVIQDFVNIMNVVN